MEFLDYPCPPADPGGESVARIIYVSSACITDSVYGEMERIRASALRHNIPLGIDTALIYQSGWFLQWKEGPGEQLRESIERIGSDRRHHSLRVVHASRGPRLLRGPWSMGLVQSNEPPEAMSARIAVAREAMRQGRQHHLLDAWRRLSAPLERGDGDSHTDPGDCQQVLVCSASGADSFDLVRWLASRYRRNVVHRRFSGAEELDVGSNFVDLGYCARTIRLIAMARRGLAVPLTRVMLADSSQFVMLLSGDRKVDERLLSRTAEAYACVRNLPALIGVCPDSKAHGWLQEAALRFGLCVVPAASDPFNLPATWEALCPLLRTWRRTPNDGFPVGLPKKVAVHTAEPESATPVRTIAELP